MVAVVLSPEVLARVHITDRPRLGAIGSQHDGKISRQKSVLAELLSNEPDVLDGREVGICARGAFCRKRHHSGAECCEHDWWQRGLRTSPCGLGHPVQVVPHRADRSGIVVSSRGDWLGVADAETQDESTRPRFGQGASTGCHGRWITRVDAGDAAGDHQP